MMSVSNILVPIDFSETSKTATKLALEWSNLLKCNVTLVHNYRLILDQKTSHQSPRKIREAIITEKMRSFDLFEKEVDYSKAFSLTTKLELGFTIDSIRRMTEKNEVDLIIYGVKSKEIPHSTRDLIKLLDADLTPILLVHGNHVVDTNEPFDQLENKIESITADDFKTDIDKLLNVLEKAPNQSYLIHPSKKPKAHTRSINSSIADRIVNFSRAN